MNPLIQRVQRYTALATLFRSPLDMESGQPIDFIAAGFEGEGTLGRSASSNLPGRSNVPLVSASLIPTSRVSFDIVEPASREIQPAQQQTLARPAGSQSAQPAAQPLSEPPAAPEQPGIQPIVLRPAPSSVQRVPDHSAQPKVELPPAQPEPASAEEENRIWNRLQTIFRKHQEKQIEEEIPASEPELVPPVVVGKPRSVQTEGIDDLPPTTDMKPEIPAQPSQGRSAGRAVIQEQPLSDQPQPSPKDQFRRNQPGQPESPQSRPSSKPTPRTQAQDNIQRHIEQDVPSEEPQTALVPAPPPLEDVEASDHSVVETLEGLIEIEPQPPVGDNVSTSSLPDTTAALLDSSVKETGFSTPPSAVQRVMESVPGKSVQAAREDAHSAPSVSDSSDESAYTPEDQTLVSSPVKIPPTSTAPEVQQGFISLPEVRRTDVYIPPGEDESDAAQAFQAVSLEAAWPVQRLAEEFEPELLPEVALHPPSAELAHSPEASQVSALLQGVTPGQPTDSQVEVVTPRRPRPAVLPPAEVQTSLQDTQPIQNGARRVTPPTVDRESARMPQMPESLDGASLVPTEIGALPSDLWALIGQEAPEIQAVPGIQESPQTQLSQPVPPPVIQRQKGEQPFAEERTQERTTEVNQPGRLIEAPPAVITYQAPASVQRVEIDEVSSSVDTREETSEAGNGGAPDIDELSRRVYQEVKRRLANEWERMRRRL